jgi:hypothetical protein
MSNQLQKAIRLAKKTGDRLIVFDSPESDNAYVVMTMDQYEKMSLGAAEVRDLTEEELLDKINRDIAVWKSEQDSESSGFFSGDSLTGRPNPVLSALPENDPSDRRPRNHWAIPSDRKRAAEEIIEEDRQYLEEV